MRRGGQGGPRLEAACLAYLGRRQAVQRAGEVAPRRFPRASRHPLFEDVVQLLDLRADLSPLGMAHGPLDVERREKRSRRNQEPGAVCLADAVAGEVVAFEAAGRLADEVESDVPSLVLACQEVLQALVSTRATPNPSS